MEKLTSSLVIHKRVATLDTRLAEMEGALVSNLLERILGFYDFGRYTKAPRDANFAFEKIADLWHEEITADLNPDNERETQSLEGNASELEEMDIETETNPEPGKKAEKKLKRKQQDEEIMMTEKRAKMDEEEAETNPAAFLKKVWTNIQASADKLIIIKRPDDTNRSNPASWHLIKVDLEERN